MFKPQFLKRVIPKVSSILLVALILALSVFSFITPQSVFAADDPHYWLPDATSGTGTGNWSAVGATGHWADDAAGTNLGKAAPDSDDSVYFGANAFNGAGQVVTIDSVASAGSLDFTGATNTPTLAFGTQTINLYGNLTFIAAMNVTGDATSSIGLRNNAGANTITTNGKAIPGIFSASTGYAGTATLADALTVTSNIIWRRGTLVTGGFQIDCDSFSDAGTADAKTLTMGASTINCTWWNYTGSNLTVTANTATINISGIGACALGTANWNGASFNLNGTAHTVSGSPTGIATFTRTGTATNANTVTFTSGATLSCTDFALVGNSRANQLLAQSSTLGTAATITSTNAPTFTNVDLMDLTFTNACNASATTGDAGGNTNVTFVAAAPQTYTDSGDHKASTAANWTSRVPLVGIDDVTIGATITYDMPRMGKSISVTGGTCTLSQSISNYGSFTLASGITYTHANNTNFLRGRSVGLTLTTGGKTFYFVHLAAPNGVYALQDSLTCSYWVELNHGTFDFNDNDCTSPYIQSGSTALTRTILLGNGTLTINNTAAGISKANFRPGTGTLTFDAEGSTIILTNSTANAQTFAGGSLVYNAVSIQGAGAYQLTVTGNNTFASFKSDDSLAAKTIVGTGTTQTVGDFTKDNGGTNVTTITNGTWTKHGRLVNATGTFVGSPVYFDAVSESIECTATGTATVTLPYGVTGTATSGVGGAVVTGSPQALVAGVNTIEVTDAGDGLFTLASTSVDSIPISLNYMSISGSTAVPANTWYAGTVGAGGSTDGGGNTGWVFDDPALTTTTQAATGVSMTAAGVTSGTFNGTETTTLEGTPTIETNFDYGLTGAYGASTAVVNVYADGAFTGTVPNNFTPGATYHFRGVTSNANAAAPFNGGDQTLTFTMPTVTSGVANIIANNIRLNGNLTAMGAASSTYIYFEYGTTPAMGNYTAAQTLAGIAAFDDTIVTPASDSTLYYRSVAQNGTGAGLVRVYGATTALAVPSAVGGNMIKLMLRVVLALAIIAGVMTIGAKGGLPLLSSAVIGILAFIIIDTIINHFL